MTGPLGTLVGDGPAAGAATESLAPLDVDLERLIGSHACIVANAGGGKSGLVRRLLETTAGRVQQIVLDPEDEFYTLRERHDFVIAGGEGSDAPAPVAAAPGLARAALEHGFSLVVQLNDLGPGGAAEFVGGFLESLIAAPRALWRPLLVVLDEAHRFAPQDGSTAATHGVHALTAQGRKRGYTAVLATQRIAKLDANVRGDVNNWFLGRVGQSLDRRTMADQLGFTAAEARERFRGLQPRHFYAFGPAIADEPLLFRVADVETTPVRPGQAKLATPPPPEALREILAGLAKPQETVTPRMFGAVALEDDDDRTGELGAAVQRAVSAEREVEQLHAERKRLETTIARLAADLEAARGFGDTVIEAIGFFDDARDRAASLLEGAIAARELRSNNANLHSAAAPGLSSPEPASKRGGGEAEPPVEEASHAASRPTPASPSPAGDGALRGRRALQALSLYPAGLTERQWAWVAGLSRKGGTWGTYKSALRSAGLIEEAGDRWRVTAAGKAEILDDDLSGFPPIGAELALEWGKKLPGTGRMVALFVRRWPEPIKRDVLAAELGMAAGGGTFGTYLSRLRAAGMLDEQGKRIRLHPELMEYHP